MKTLDGVVVSTKTKDTAVVAVSRKVKHKLYRKLLGKTKRFKADTKDTVIVVGQTVRIGETRPYSKDKHFKIIEVIDKTPRVKLIGEEKAMREVLGEKEQVKAAKIENRKPATTENTVSKSVRTVKTSGKQRLQDSDRTVVVRKRKEQVL